MAYDIGLITMLIVGKCITYTIWVKRLRRELQFRMFAVSGANYSVGQWVQCVISEGAYGGDFRIQTFRKTKMVQEECIVTQDGGVEITTDVRFPVATGCAHSEFFGHVRMRPGVDWPSEGTHKCVIVRTPIDTNMPIPYHTNWMGIHVFPSTDLNDLESVVSGASSTLSDNDKTTALVVFVDEASDASLWTRDDLGRGHIFVTTKYSAGDRDLLRRGQWISCRFKPYEGPLREVDFEVTSFEECREDLKLLPLVRTRDEFLVATTNIRVADLEDRGRDGLGILKRSSAGLGNVAVLDSYWYLQDRGREYLHLRSDMRVQARCIFSPWNTQRDAFWYVVSIQFSPEESQCVLKKSDLEARNVGNPLFDFMQGPIDVAYGQEKPRSLQIRSVGRSIEDCRSWDDLKEFLASHKEELRAVWWQGQPRHNVAAVKMHVQDNIVYCFSPQFGWCASLPESRYIPVAWETIGFGDWALVTIVPSSTGLVRWIMEPVVKKTHPSLQLFCGNLDAEFNLMGAIAFNNLLKTTADFRIFDTSMGKAWVSTELFHGDAVDVVARVQCPEQCLCFSEAPRRSPAPSQNPGSSYESRVSQGDGWKVSRRSPALSQCPGSLYESSRHSSAPPRRPGNPYEPLALQSNGWGDLPQPGPSQRSWDNVVGYAGYDDEEDGRFDVRRREAPRSEDMRFDPPERRCSDSPPDDPTLDGGPSFSEALRPRDAVRRPMVFQKSTRREEELQPNSRRSSGGRFANLRVVGRDAHQEEVERPPTDEEVRIWEEALEASDRERMEAQDYEAPSQESQEAIEADRALVPVSSSQDDSCASSVSTSPPPQQASSVDTPKEDPPNEVQVVQEAQSEDETDDSDEDVLSQPGERHANDAEDVEMFDVDSEEDE